MFIERLDRLVLLGTEARTEVEKGTEVTQECKFASKHCLVIVEAAFNHKHLVHGHSVILLHLFLQLHKLTLLDHINVELSHHVKGVVGIVTAHFGLPIVDLLISLRQEVVELVASRCVRFAECLRDVVTLVVAVKLDWLALGCARKVEPGWSLPSVTLAVITVSLLDTRQVSLPFLLFLRQVVLHPVELFGGL